MTVCAMQVETVCGTVEPVVVSSGADGMVRVHSASGACMGGQSGGKGGRDGAWAPLAEFPASSDYGPVLSLVGDSAAQCSSGGGGSGMLYAATARGVVEASIIGTAF